MPEIPQAAPQPLPKCEREDRYMLKILTELWLKHMTYAQRRRVVEAAFKIARTQQKH